MEEARCRALTQLYILPCSSKVTTVEMEEARCRALTHESFNKFFYAGFK